MIIEIIGKSQKKALQYLSDTIGATVRFPHIITKNPEKFSEFPGKFIHSEFVPEQVNEIVTLQKESVELGLKDRPNVLIIDDGVGQYYNDEVEGMIVVYTHQVTNPDVILVNDISNKQTYNNVLGYWGNEGRFDDFLKGVDRGSIIKIERKGGFSVIPVAAGKLDFWIPGLEA